MSQRIPDWVLERYAAGELPPGYSEASISADPSVPERLAALRKSDEEILAAHPPAGVAREVERRAHLAATRDRAAAGERRLRGFWPGALAATAAAALVAIVAPRILQGPADDELRVKGDPHLLIYRQAAGAEPEKLSEGARARAGDVLQLRIFASDARYAAVVSIDGAGAATLHAPAREGPAMALRVGGTDTLPESYALDAAPGFERFVLVTSDRPFDAAEVLAAARALGPEPRAPLALPGSLKQTSFLLEKAAP